MSKAETKGRAAYEKAREAFTELDMQDKAAFVLEATFSTFGEAFKDAGQQFADVIEKVTDEDFFDAFAWQRKEDADSASEEKAKDEKASNGRKKSGARATSKKKKDKDADD